MTDVSNEVDQVRLYTMRELNQDTSGTIEKINNSGKPGVITRHGRFVAVIYPLANASLESRVIARALEDVEIQNQITGASTVGGIRMAEEAAADLGVNANVEDADRELSRESYGQ
ncbi:hypothetical protein [Mycolicibacterium fluoranthenivorans]|uniref:Antitoxin n=1 Tax=Mycolicibacterium fluoranthenivorans TaxID=258505 RepID=A0A1G4W1N8_9MYCO|nr:hypothetical protein [Mycolicibacterium fluoranthenivorans]SCX15288.1 hypothetical protein SAMN02799620_02030 [Mycolicibacterium fluoranthenivorans]